VGRVRANIEFSRDGNRSSGADLGADCRALLGVGFEHPLQRFHDLEAYDLARASARKLGVGEAQDADTLVRAESRADFLKMGAQVIFHCAAAFSARVGGHDQRGGLLTLANFQADDRKFLDIRGMAVNLFEFVDVNIVAAGIDDHVLGAAHDVEPSVLELTEIDDARDAFREHLGQLAQLARGPLDRDGRREDLGIHKLDRYPRAR